MAQQPKNGYTKMPPLECCGQTHSSRFCPHCGNMLQKHSLETLLAHCKQSQKACRRRLDDTHIKEATQPDRTGNSPSPSISSAMQKWALWVDCLESLIESSRK